VTKVTDTHWNIIKSIVVATILDHITAGLPILEINIEKTKTLTHLSLDEQEIVKQIVEIIETKVRPAVAQDGGDILFHSYDHSSGIVYVEMQGACSGCPSSTITLKDGIENMLQYYVPEVIRVEQI